MDWFSQFYHRHTHQEMCNTVFNFSPTSNAGPSRATAGPGKPLSCGPTTTHRRRKGGVSGGCGARPPSPPKKKKSGKYFSGKYQKHHKYHPIKGLGERRKLPQRGPGQSPGRKWILCIFQVRKKPSGTPFSVFWAMAGLPKGSGALENFPRFPPLDGPDQTSEMSVEN